MVHDSPCSFPATAVMGEACIKVGPQSSWGQRGDTQVDLWPNTLARGQPLRGLYLDPRPPTMGQFSSGHWLLLIPEPLTPCP